MQPVIILHHHEITLKGKNRAFFEQQLLKNIRNVLAGFDSASAVTGGYGRSAIARAEHDDPDKLMKRLSRVFGLANITSGLCVSQSIDAFCEAARSLLENRQFGTIRVDTRRVDKRFPMNSMAVNETVGKFLCTHFGVGANLSSPDETIFIEIVNGVAYVTRGRINGPGGLPSGISGRVAALLSAGFDSPVAAWQIMKRGCTVIPVHFHSMPYTSQHSIDQVRQLVNVLTLFQYRMKLYLVPFAELQQEIVLRTPQPLRVILYRRMMVRIAEALTRRDRVEALVTGEAVGQVASQTLRNIRAIDAVATLPILRPLSGMDKEETMVLARRIGTYEISKEPYDDCCSFLAPRKPETWSSLDEVDDAESKLDIPALIDSATRNAAVETFACPASEPSQ